MNASIAAKNLHSFGQAGGKQVHLVLTAAQAQRRYSSYCVDSRQNVTGAGARQGFVASRSRLPKAVKNCFSWASILFFKANGSRAACSARSRAFVASGISALPSRRACGVCGLDS